MVDEQEFSALLAAARNGEERALTALYRELQPRLVGFLSGFAPGEAEDLATETWIDAARCLPDFEDDGAGFRRLLFTIARRRAIDHARKWGRRKTDPVDPGTLPGLRMSHPDLANSVVDDDASRRAIAQVRAMLTESQAEVVLLRVVGGLSVAEVAQIVGRSEGAVRVLQTRGLQRLADRIGTPASWNRQSSHR